MKEVLKVVKTEVAMGDSEVLMSDKVVQELMGEQGDLIQTGSPAILCTPLPNHWRSNKSLPVAFKVFTFQVVIKKNFFMLSIFFQFFSLIFQIPSSNILRIL